MKSFEGQRNIGNVPTIQWVLTTALYNGLKRQNAANRFKAGHVFSRFIGRLYSHVKEDYMVLHS